MAVVSTSMIIVGLLAGCGSKTDNSTGSAISTNQTQAGGNNSSKPVAGGTIQVDAGQDFPHLDPALAYEVIDWEVLPQMYDQLITYKPQSTEFKGDIATSWNLSPDGKTYTFHLRHRVTFWNGDKVTAQSFIDEFQRVLDKNVGSPAVGFVDQVIVGSDAYYQEKAKTISGISASGSYTLVIHLTHPEPYFLDVLAMPFFSAVDMAYINKVGQKNFDHDAMGTGPFELASYAQGNKLVLKKNPNYFIKGTPYLNEVDFVINSNEQTSALKFKQGQSAFISSNQTLDSADFVEMMNDPRYKNELIKQTLVATKYLALNTKPKSPMQNKLVREAINLAIDKQKLVHLQNGRAQVTNQMLPPAMPGYENNLPPNVVYPYNPTKAKQLLHQAGYGNGFTIKMLTTNDSTTLTLAQSIQADLKTIGITVDLKSEGAASYVQDANKLRYPIVFAGWYQDFPDPEDFLDVLGDGNEIAAGNNRADYNNPTVNKQLAEAGSMLNGPARYALYSKIQNEILADVPWVPLYNPVQYAAVQPWLKGFYMSPVLEDPLQNLWIAPH